jgi:hypothetical protein
VDAKLARAALSAALVALAMTGACKSRDGAESGARPKVVDVPGRAPGPLVVYTAGSEPPPSATPSSGARGVALAGDSVWVLDDRRRVLFRQRRSTCTCTSAPPPAGCPRSEGSHCSAR